MIDLYPVMLVGASVYILGDDMRLDLRAMNEYMEQNHLTIAFMTTQIGCQIATMFNNKSLRLLATGGEKMPAITPPDYRFLNVYGPTECSLFSTYYDVKSYFEGEFIGKPLDNYQLYIIDHIGRLVPEGIPGELLIAGEGVGRGYLNRPDLTAENATPHSDPWPEKFITFRGQRAYRSGDLVRWAVDPRDGSKQIEFLGRIDNQVKLRGYRIELSEIETCASRFEGVGQAVAQVVDGQKICLYFTVNSDILRPDGQSVEHIDVDALKKHLANSLTSYMIPSTYMQLDALPMMSNGKIDRSRLPKPTEAATSETVQPRTEKEAVTLVMAQLVLGRDDFGVTDDLFDLGLTSITAMKLTAMTGAYGISISVNNLMRLRTIQRLFSTETPIGYWFNTYSPEKPLLVVPHGVVPVISMTEKFLEWQDYFSIYTFEPTDEHAARIVPDFDYEKLAVAYADLMEHDIPADAQVYGFLGYSWGGELCYSLANVWRKRHGGSPNVYLCDTYYHEPDNPKMTEEQILQSILSYLMTHANDFDMSALQADGNEVNGTALDVTFLKCTKDTGFAGEIMKIATGKFLYGELYRRSRPLPVYDGRVTLFVATREHPCMEKTLSGWRKAAPSMEIIYVDDNHLNFCIRNNNTYIVTERLLEELRLHRHALTTGQRNESQCNE